MQINCVLCITDRDRQSRMEAVFGEAGVTGRVSALASGTARTEHLLRFNLMPTEKSLIAGAADPEQTKKLFSLARRRMDIDIPGNGVMMAVPIKSVGGRQTLAYFKEQSASTDGTPDMSFTHELVVAIVNDGFSDQVMDAARQAGAGGGTVIHAKGTGVNAAQKFFSFTLTNEREMVCIAAPASKKQAIMQAILREAGADKPAAAICFSLPISELVGLREQAEE